VATGQEEGACSGSYYRGAEGGINGDFARKERPMMAWLDTLGYRLCWRSGRLASLWALIWYRYRCPYPIIKDHSARACVATGHCGCDNRPRYPQETEQ
jgi:hypothetical protein